MRAMAKLRQALGQRLGKHVWQDLEKNLQQPRYWLPLSLWAIILLTLFSMGQWSEHNAWQWLRLNLDKLQGSAWAWLWLLLVYLIRPILLLPISILTLASGLFFGVFWGFLYANIAIMLSTIIAYYIGWYFGDTLPSLPKAWQQRIQHNTFSSTFLSRIVAIPGDLVNYAAGMLRVKLAPFLLATLLGGSPGLLVGILVGAALESSLEEGKFVIKSSYLLAAGALLLLVSALAWWLRRFDSSTYAKDTTLEEKETHEAER